jgi:Mlc titration factor MtfA (ptsG expression regulator)
MPSILSRTGWARARRQRTPLPSSVLALLETHVAYYRVLPAAEQEALRGMLQVLLGELSFEAGAGLPVVDDEMRVAIAAQACVLLLHRPLDELPTLRTAIVYPAIYQARERVHTPEGVEVDEIEERHGEAWAHGVLLLSWEDVAYDSTHIDDGQNVVFHEVAHALDDLTGGGDGIPLLADRAAVVAWQAAFGAALADLEQSLRQRHPTLLDPYAAEGPAEFFAVATEAFFEMPRPFQAEYPALYLLLRDFYRLDPAGWANLLASPGPKSPARRRARPRL